MTTPGTNFVASKDTVLKEGYFKKRNFKGELGHAYSRRWCVLTSRYFEWFDHPVRPKQLKCVNLPNQAFVEACWIIPLLDSLDHALHTLLETCLCSRLLHRA